MKGLKTLILMQLKDKVDLSFTKSVKSTIFKVVTSILKFAIITFVIYILFYVLEFLRLVSVLPGIPQNFITTMFTIMFLLSIFACTLGIMKSLYFSKDNAFLLTMPTNKLAVFTSKIVVYYIYELIRNAFYILPLFISYGLINKLPIYYYPWLIVVLPAVTLLSVSVGALLSIFAMQIAKILKTYKLLEYSFVTIVIVALVFTIISLIKLIPENLNIVASWGSTFWKIQNFMTKFLQIFAPITWLVKAIIGSRVGVANIMFNSQQWLAFLSLILFAFGILGLSFIIVQPVFFKMVSFPFEYKKKKVDKSIKNKKLPSWFSAIKKELAICYRTPEKFYGLLTVVLGLPIAILLLNKIYSAMDTRLTGSFMTIAFNILVILLIALSSNASISYTYSEEGASSYLLKTFPKPYIHVVTSKLIVNMVLVSASLLASVIIFSQYSILTTFQTILLYLSLNAVYIGHLLWAAENDIMNSQTHQYQTTGGHINNPNERKTIITAVLLSVAFAFMVLFLIPESLVKVWYKLAFVAFAFLAGRIWLFINKVNVYFKERQ